MRLFTLFIALSRAEIT